MIQEIKKALCLFVISGILFFSVSAQKKQPVDYADPLDGYFGIAMDA